MLRMANDTVISGLVNAKAEGVEKVSLNEAEIAVWQRLQTCKSDTLVPNNSNIGIDIKKSVGRLQQGFLDASSELDYQQHLSRFRAAVDEQLCLVIDGISNCLQGSNLQNSIGADCEAKLLQFDGRIDRLKVLLAFGFEQTSAMLGLLEALVFEQQSEYDLQKEVFSIIIQKHITGLHEEYEMKLWEHQHCIGALNKDWEEKNFKVTALRDELNAVLNSMTGPELGVLSSHCSLEGIEEWNFLKRKDDDEFPVNEKHRDLGEPMIDIPDFSLLKHMSGEEVTAFLKSEWLKLRRQQELALQEKTEDLFRLKRYFAKDKAPLPLRKEREIEFIKTKLPQTISKLDEILLRKGNCSFNYSDHDEMCRLKDRIAGLLHENEDFQDLLADKIKAAKQLSSQVSDAESKMEKNALLEVKLLNRIKKLKGELEDLKMESHLNNLLDQTILGVTIGSHENYIDDVEIQSKVLQEIYSVVVRDALSTIKSMEQHHAEQASLKEMLVQMEKQLSVVNEDNQKLKYDNEQLASVAILTLMQYNEEVNLVNHKLNMLTEHASEQEELILECKEELKLMKNSLNEALQKIHVCNQEIHRLNENLDYASFALEEVKEQNASLRVIIQNMEKTSVPSITTEKGHVKHLEFVLASMEKLSKVYSDFESRSSQSMQRNEIRLTNISSQFNRLVQQVALLKKKEFWYKQTLEVKCSNLQKAEAEVDILGDEVDNLLSVLEKIYVVLDHYSSVLQHYPGVMEILKTVQRVLKGEGI